MEDFKLRAATEKDLKPIHDLIHEVQINPMDLDWHQFVVAETGRGDFVGCGQVKSHRDGSLEMASIAVKEPYRGQGAARLVIERLLRENPRPLYLMCRGGLGPFYEKFGFRSMEVPEMPEYFQRILKLMKVVNRLGVGTGDLLVMRLD